MAACMCRPLPPRASNMPPTWPQHRPTWFNMVPTWLYRRRNMAQDGPRKPCILQCLFVLNLNMAPIMSPIWPTMASTTLNMAHIGHQHGFNIAKAGFNFAQHGFRWLQLATHGCHMAQVGPSWPKHKHGPNTFPTWPKMASTSPNMAHLGPQMGSTSPGHKLALTWL